VVTPFDTPRREHEDRAENETYNVILQAERRQIYACGYHSVTIDDIVKQAGVSRATFYFYFRNKQHLFIQVANTVMNQMYEVAGQHYPNEDEYTRIVLANAAYLDVWARETKIIGEFFALSLVDTTIHTIYDNHRRRFEERIAGRLGRLLAQKRIPPADPKLLAATLSAMVEFFAFRFFATDEVVSRRQYTFEEAVRILSETWYRAVYGRMPPDDYPYERFRQEERQDGSD
jgi:AcrR family transcriptional regulator